MSDFDPGSAAIPLVIATDPDAWITIFDGFDAVVLPARPGDQTISLMRGIYTIRCERAGQSTQDVILHTAARQLSIQPPPMASAAPLEGAVTTHEYYHDSSQKWSVAPTAVLADRSGPGWIFIFIRAWDEQAYRKGTNLGSGFELLDPGTGESIADLADRKLTVRDEYFGYTAFSVSIRPGYYVLCYMGSDRWAMPVHVFPDRSTQVFVLFHRKPLVESVRVFYRGLGETFRAEDADAIDVDLALTGLSGGFEAAERAIPRRREGELLSGKFQDPMFGLVGAHWFFSRADAQPQHADLVLNNLRSLLPGSPDVAALEVLAAARWHRPSPTPAAFPPMLSAGLRALLSDPERHIKPGSFLEEILVRLRAGSPWVVWAPEARSRTDRRTQAAMPADSGDQWVQRVLLQALSNPDPDASGENEDMVVGISSELRLPRNVVSRALRNLNRSADSEPVRVEIAGSLAPDCDPVPIEVGKPEEWTWRAALLLNEPFPRVDAARRVSIPLAGRFTEPIVLPGRNPVMFESREGEGRFLVFEDRRLLLAGLDTSGVLAAAIPPEARAGHHFILFRWNYNVSRASPGDLALGLEGPAYRPPTSNYALAYPFPRYWGARYALDSALKHWRLPSQIQGVDDLAPGELICADIPGSFEVRFRAHTRLNLVNVGGGRTGSARAATEVGASVCGVFRVLISRQSTDPERHALQFRLFESPGAMAPVVSVRTAAVGSARESVPGGGEQIRPTLWPRMQEVAALAAARSYSHTLCSRLAGLSHEPLIACELDFGTDTERAAAQLRDLLQGVFDRNASELSGDLVTATEEDPALNVRISSGDASVIELGSSGDITLRPPAQTRSAMISKVLASRIYHEEAGPLQATLLAAFAEPSVEFLRFYLRPLLNRFSLARGASSTGERVENLLSGLMAEGTNVTMAIEIEWPRGIESSWVKIDASQVAGLNARLGVELRFWRPLLALADETVLGDFDYASAFLVYGALPPGFDPRTQPMALSLPVLNELGESLIHMLPVGDHRYSVPACVDQAEQSMLFRELLEFEDRVFAAATRAVNDRASLVDLLSLIGEEFSLPLRVPREALQTILFAGGALQLAGHANLAASAAIGLNLLRPGPAFPPEGFPLHADPPLSDVIAQLRLQPLGDALKPIAAAAAAPKIRKASSAGA